MDRVGGGDLFSKLYEIMQKAEKHGFGERNKISNKCQKHRFL